MAGRGGVSRRRVLSAAGVATVGAAVGTAVGVTPAAGASAELGHGGAPMEPAAVARLARDVGRGEPLAVVDLAAMDRNIEVLRTWSATSGITWRPAFKTLQSVGLLAYVVSTLDSPRVMIHHLRNLAPAMSALPVGTDFLMGYPPSVGELERYVTTRPRRGEPRHLLRICIDSPRLLDQFVAIARRSARPLPLDVALEIDNGGPRGGFAPGAELSQALRVLRGERKRLRLGALLCYDALAAGESDPAWRLAAAKHAQNQLQ